MQRKGKSIKNREYFDKTKITTIQKRGDRTVPTKQRDDKPVLQKTKWRLTSSVA